MKRSFSFLLGLVSLCAAETPGQPVRIYDLAKVPAATLEHALVVAGRALRDAGVQIIWEQGSSEAPEAHITDYTPASSPGRRLLEARDYLVVALQAGPPDRVRPGLTGYALPYARQGAHAVVFYDRIEKLYSRLRCWARCRHVTRRRHSARTRPCVDAF